ncbi:MAG: PD-(D/E)XK nuclease family protein [Granulosicoccus sp.]
MDNWHALLHDGAVLLTVNQRLARHHVAQHAAWQQAQGRSWWQTPAILPWQSWLVSLHDEALATGLTRRVRLPAILQQQRWRQALVKDHSTVLLDIDAAAQSARQAWATSCLWACRNDSDAYLSHDQYTWQRWCDDYRAGCKHDQLVDDAELADHLRTLISSDASAWTLPERLLLDGFLTLAPQQQALIETLTAAGVEVIKSSPQPKAELRRDVHDDDQRELLAVASEMRQVLDKDFTQRLGVVIPDLQQRRAVVMRAFDRVFFPGKSPLAIAAIGRPYDISLGLPLADTAIVNTALMLLRLVTRGIEGNELSALLTSPYLVAADAEARSREKVDKSLRSDRVRRLDVEGLRSKLESGQLRDSLHVLLKSRRTSSAVASDWADRFSQWLKTLGWPGESLDSEEHQTLQAWCGCLDDLQVLDDGNKLAMHEAVALVVRLARERVFQPESPATPVQIMGRLESHGIAFDRLWVTGFDADQWPPQSNPTPFLSIAAQKAAGVPDASVEVRLAMAEREYELWQSQTPLLVVSHAGMRNDSVLAPAAVIEALPVANVSLTLLHVPPLPGDTEAGKRVGKESRNVRVSDAATPLGSVGDLFAGLSDEMVTDDAAKAGLAGGACQDIAAAPMRVIYDSIQLEQFADDHGEPVAEGTLVGGGARLFQDQALCPFRAFAMYRLQIRPLEEPGIGLDARQHGKVLHKALELFWQSTQTHAELMLLTDDGLQAALKSAIETALDAAPVAGVMRQLEQLRLLRLLSEWVEQCEKPRTPFEVLAFEDEREIAHGGIVMNVTLDRIDRVDGALVVIDYKSGVNNPVKTWSDKRMENSQLPLYVLTDEAIQGVSFAQVAHNKCVFKGVGSNEHMLPNILTQVEEISDWQGWRAHWRAALDVVAAEVREGLASVTPMKSACQYCELKSLCRIQSVESPIDEESDALPGDDGVAGAYHGRGES